MMTEQPLDPDIIDYAGFAAGGHIDDHGNHYLTIPIVTPPHPLPRGRPSLDDDARELRYFFCAWSLRVFHMARALGRSRPEAEALLDARVSSMTAASAMTIGREVCRSIMGMPAGEYGKDTQQQMKAICAEQGAEHAEAVLADALHLFDRFDHAYKRALALKARIYQACHGDHAPLSDEAFTETLSPLASEEHFPLPVATRVSLLTGVNMAWLWQDQWHYRYIFQTAAALRGWTRGEGAELSLAEYYILYRCAHSADPDDLTQHGWVKRFLARQIEEFYSPREHFLGEAEEALRNFGVLPQHPGAIAKMFPAFLAKPPRTVAELFQRCEAVDDEGNKSIIQMQPRPVT